MSLLTGIRAFWWRRIRRYAYEICQSCGRPVGKGIGGTYWRAPDEIWAAVAGWDGWDRDCGELAYLGPPGTMCPRCFTESADALGIRISWKAVTR